MLRETIPTAHVGILDSSPLSSSPFYSDLWYLVTILALLIGLAFIGVLLYGIHRRERPPRPERGRDLGGRRHLLTASLLTLALSAVLVWGVLNVRLTPTLASREGALIDSLFRIQFVMAAVIFALVIVFLLYSIAVFRQRPGDTRDGPPDHGNPRLETAWTLIPLLIVIGLGIYGAAVLNEITAPPEDRLPMIVEVTAFQWGWSFEYPEENLTTTELGLPVHRPILFRLTSKDVVHSFYVFEFRVKMDAVPGMATELLVTPTRVGEYQLLCAELCGLGHAYMKAPVRVMEEEDFRRWISSQRGK
jgi:cytochrome c oxidase subunit 2